MAATLIHMEEVVDWKRINNQGSEKRENDYIELTNRMKGQASNVDGHKAKEVNSIPGDFVNLAKAVSVSNFVVDLLTVKNSYKVDKVYQTGSNWATKIKAFNGFNAKELKSQDFIMKN